MPKGHRCGSEGDGLLITRAARRQSMRITDLAIVIYRAFALLMADSGRQEWIFLLFCPVQHRFAEPETGRDENFLPMHDAVRQQYRHAETNFSEKIFWRIGKRLYLCIRFRRKTAVEKKASVI